MLRETDTRGVRVCPASFHAAKIEHPADDHAILYRIMWSDIGQSELTKQG
jgi:hypothetical protein